MKRRDFLQLCGAAAGAYAITPRARAQGPALRPPKRLVLVFVTGGWDTCYALDPKEPTHADVPAGATQMFGGLDVFVDPSRPNITEYFERYAAASAIVRGISVDAINHNECQRRIATGAREESSPDFGATVAHDLADDLPLPYLILGDTAYTGTYAASAGRVGTTNQIVQLLDPSAGGLVGTTAIGATPDAPLSDSEQALLRSYAQASAARARAIRGSAGYNRKRIDDFVSSIDRAQRLRAIRSAFGARGAAQSYLAQIDLALDALQQGISHAAMISTRYAWDTHSDNEWQGGFFDATFQGLTHLLDELSRRPGIATGSKMIDDTVVVAFSELSRTPRLSGTDPHAGKDHWPVTSALVAGAGVRGGQVFGHTDPDTLSIPIDLSTGQPSATGVKPLYTHFFAGVLALCGCDPAAHIDANVFDAFAV